MPDRDFAAEMAEDLRGWLDTAIGTDADRTHTLDLLADYQEHINRTTGL